MRIAFIHEGKAYLPGIPVYTKYFQSLGFECQTVLKKDQHSTDADVHWHFMGTDRKTDNNGKLIIHEYASASVPPFSSYKNTLKRKISAKPHLRIFLNDFVRQQMDFKDNIPFRYRDIGIYPLVSELSDQEKKYDFIYSGAIRTDMKMAKLIDVFARGPLRNKKLLILGGKNKALQNEFTGFTNIIFHDPVPGDQVKLYLRQSQYGINFKPDIIPYNNQTSTKFLEYANIGLPIITSDLPWVRNFQQKYGGEYFYLNKDLSNLSWEAVQQFEFKDPNLEDWTWENQLRSSGITEILNDYRDSGKLPENE